MGCRGTGVMRQLSRRFRLWYLSYSETLWCFGFLSVRTWRINATSLTRLECQPAVARSQRLLTAASRVAPRTRSSRMPARSTARDCPPIEDLCLLLLLARDKPHSWHCRVPRLACYPPWGASKSARSKHAYRCPALHYRSPERDGRPRQWRLLGAAQRRQRRSTAFPWAWLYFAPCSMKALRHLRFAELSLLRSAR